MVAAQTGSKGDTWVETHSTSSPRRFGSRGSLLALRLRRRPLEDDEIHRRGLDHFVLLIERLDLERRRAPVGARTGGHDGDDRALDPQDVARAHGTRPLELSATTDDAAGDR